MGIRESPHRPCATIWPTWLSPSMPRRNNRRTFLRPFVDGPLMASFCLTEPGAGSDNSAMTTCMIKQRRRDLSLKRLQMLSLPMPPLRHSSRSSARSAKPSGQFIACVVIPAGTPQRSGIRKWLRNAAGRSICPDRRPDRDRRQGRGQTGTTPLQYRHRYV